MFRETIALLFIAALIYHYRASVVQTYVKNYLQPTSKDNPVGAEFQAVSWANYLQSTGSVGASCCLPRDLKQLHLTFCKDDGYLDMREDAIPLLSSCTDYVRGRMEHPMEMFEAHHFEGTLRHKGFGRYEVREGHLVLDEKTKKERKPFDAKRSMACARIKHCMAKDKAKDKDCVNLVKFLDGC